MAGTGGWGMHACFGQVGRKLEQSNSELKNADLTRRPNAVHALPFIFERV